MIEGNLSMNKPRILFYDVETSPILGYTFGIYDTNVAHVVRDTHLMSFAWKWSDEKTIHSHSLIDHSLYKKDPVEVLKWLNGDTDLQ